MAVLGQFLEDGSILTSDGVVPIAPGNKHYAEYFSSVNHNP